MTSAGREPHGTGGRTEWHWLGRTCSTKVTDELTHKGEIQVRFCATKGNWLREGCSKRSKRRPEDNTIKTVTSYSRRQLRRIR